MIFVSPIALFVYLFGAYAYSATTLLCLRQLSPAWGPGHVYAEGAPSDRE